MQNFVLRTEFVDMKKMSKIKKLDKLVSNARAQGGFSLIEISILLIVVGFIFIPIMRVLDHDWERAGFTRTLGVISTAEDGINTFYANNSAAYPCPAGLVLSSDHAESGVSRDCSDLNNFANCTNPNWLTDTNGGVCRTSGAAGNAVIIGAVPFADARFDLETSLDFWGNKIIYAVPFLNTDADATNNYQGVRMNSLNSAGATVSVTDGEILLFSTGETARGGFTKDGVQIEPCGVAADGYETENCDFDNTFFRNEGSDGVFSRVTGAGFYDDITRTQESFPISTWFEHQDNPAVGSGDKRFAITNSVRVGIGTNSPENTLHVVGGGIRIESGGAVHGSGFEPGGTLKTPMVCATGGSDCFEPEKITDSRAEMRCDAAGNLHGTQVVMSVNGVSSSGVHVSCSSPEDSSGDSVLTDGRSLALDTSLFPASDCTVGGTVAGTVAIGINSSGEVICVVP